MKWCEIKAPCKLQPFSHKPGALIPLPTVPYVVQAFPTLIRILDDTGRIVKEKFLEVTGPVEGFTALCDLERECVTIFSRHYYYHVLSNLDIVASKKAPACDQRRERLFLGCLKKQQFEQIAVREDLCEILPIWHRLGNALKLPKHEIPSGGLFTLLDQLKTCIENKQHAELVHPLINLFRAGFSDMFVPKKEDDLFQGIVKDQTPLKGSAFYLLKETAYLLRSLFYKHQNEMDLFLPHMPPQCHAGSLLNIKHPLGTLHFKWSKKALKQVWLEAAEVGTFSMGVSSSLKNCRLKRAARDRGIKASVKDIFEINSPGDYVWDRFEK